MKSEGQLCRKAGSYLNILIFLEAVIYQMSDHQLLGMDLALTIIQIRNTNSSRVFERKSVATSFMPDNEGKMSVT